MGRLLQGHLASFPASPLKDMAVVKATLEVKARGALPQDWFSISLLRCWYQEHCMHGLSRVSLRLSGATVRDMSTIHVHKGVMCLIKCVYKLPRPQKLLSPDLGDSCP